MSTTTLIADIETDGLLDQMTQIHSIVLKCLETGEVFSCTDHSNRKIDVGVQLLAEADTVVFHNGIKFDIPAIQKLYPQFDLPKDRVVDTLVLSRLIFPTDVLRDRDWKLKRVPKKLKGSHSLEAWGYRLGVLKGDYGSKESAWDKWTPEMQEYCEQDVEVTEKLFLRLMREADEVMSDGKPAFGLECRELEHRVQWIIARQERHGFAFDQDKADELLRQLLSDRAEIEGQLQSVFKPMYLPKGPEFIPKRDNAKLGYVEGAPLQKIELTVFNPGSRAHVARWLKAIHGWVPKEKTETGLPKVDETVLERLPYPEAKLLARYFTIQKRLGQLSEGDNAWLKHVTPKWRIHGSVTTNGAVTGRMTHSHPNIAQVPANHAAYGALCRSCFRAGVGYKLVGCDADGLELRDLAGYMAHFDGGSYIQTVLEGDKAQGTDMHSVNTRAIGLDPTKEYTINGQTKSGRDIAKTWFYGFIYGAGDEKLGTIVGKPAGNKAKAQGKADRQKFLKNLPALKKLTERVKGRAEEQGFIRGLDGRRLTIRHQHAALNTLLQSAGAIQMKQALVILDDTLQSDLGLVPGKDYEFVANIHDEVVIEVIDKDNIPNRVLAVAEDSIRLAGEHFKFRCPLSGSGAVGDTWSEIH